MKNSENQSLKNSSLKGENFKGVSALFISFEIENESSINLFGYQQNLHFTKTSISYKKKFM